MKKYLLLMIGFCLSFISLDLVAQNEVQVFVFEDDNGDGVQDGAPDELGITGVSTADLVLYYDLNGNGLPDAAPTDVIINHDGGDGAGTYTFSDPATMPDGDYFLSYTGTPGSYHITLLNAGGPATDSDLDPATGFSIGFPLAGGVPETDIDLGLYLASSIGDFVWEDLDGNGAQDGGEPGINGLNVTLIDAVTNAPITMDANGPIAANPVVTAGGGIYNFPDLIPGDYRVEFSAPAPVGGVDWYTTVTIDVDPTDGMTDSDADPADMFRSHIIVLGSDEIEDKIDAGFWLPAKIGNKVFCDENGDGIDNDGGMGVPDINVNIIDVATNTNALDADGIVQAQIRTDALGEYEFDLIPPGDYIIEFSFAGAPSPTNPPFVFTLQDQGADEMADSDVNPAPGGMFGRTPQIEITSQDTDEELIWDAGVYQVFEITGSVWYDDDLNGALNGTEGGPAGVQVNLFNADTGLPIDNVFTTAGVYEFPSNPGVQIPPGNYYVEIDISAFSGPLSGAQPCVGFNPADDMVDDDDNGSDGQPAISTTFTLLSNCDPTTPPIVEYVDFCYFFDCNTPNDLAVDFCSDAEAVLICDINTLSSFCAIMPTGDVGGNQPTPLCPGTASVANNISWFAFVAYGGTYSVTVTPENCTDGGNGNQGVQIGLYTDCTFTEAAYCQGACSINPVTFDSADLEEGQTYYFFIDGCAGSVCSYEVSISGNPEPPNLEPDDMCIDNAGNIECVDGGIFCPDASLDFVVQGIDLTVDYTWDIITVSGGPYTGSPSETTTEGTLPLTFTNEGEYTICISSINNGCQFWNGNYCRTITIAGLDDEEFDLQEVCDLTEFNATFNPMTTLSNGTATNPLDPNGDATEGWQGPTPVNFVVGTNTVPITTAQGCEYEQEFDLALYPVSDVGLFDMSFCRADLPIIIDGTQYTETTFGGSNTFNLPGIPLVNETDVNGCDSIIDIELEILDVFNGSLTAGVCTPDGVILEFAYDLSLSTDVTFITWEWTDPSGNNLPDDTFNPTDILDNIAPTATGSGMYTLTATVTKDGVTCIFPFMVDIDFAALLPPAPTISGSPVMICESDSIQTYTASDFGDAFNYIWDVDNGVILSGGGLNDQTIEINWAGNTNGSVTLTGVNGCGNGDPTPFSISLVPILTPDFSVTAEVCQDSSAIIMFSGPTTDIDSYSWGFDGGTVNNATGGTGPGPHEVSWSTVGDHTVTLTVLHNGGCTSTQTFDIVNTIAPTPVTINTCTSSAGQVVFTWVLTPGTVESDYSVEVITGQVGVLSGTMYTIDGLGANEIVDIEVTLLSGDACVSTTANESCIAQDCTPPDISISIPGGDTFCLDGTDQSFDLSANIPAGVPGAGEYAGVGITDIVAGTFDPTTAGVGVHNIIYTYLTDDGCTAIADTTFIVNEVPMALFAPSMDTVCITDAVTLTYQGTTGINTSDYTVTDGQTFSTSEPIITFTQTGVQTISLTVVKDGCESTVYTDEVFVQPELEPISVDCSVQDIDNVEFGWNPVAGATGYSVVVTNADGSVDPAFITTDLTYGQGSLNPNDSISITVTVLSDSRCPGSSDTQKCYANECPTVDVTIDPIDTEYCLDGNNAVVDLTAVWNGDGDDTGVLVWSGDGVTGTQFDPNGLSEGTTTISVEYIENGCGGYSDDIIVNILQAPIAAFDVSLNPICVGSTLPFTFTGSSLPGQTIDWSSSDVTVTATANPNEYEATFPNAGTFDLVLNVANGANCDATPAMATVVVEPELSFGEVDCLPSENEISFSWAAVDCATDYEIFLSIADEFGVFGPEMSQGVQSTTTFLANGLTEGTEVSIRVVAISDCACDDVMMTRSCETSACVQVTLDVSVMGGETDFCFATATATDVLTNLTDNTADGSGSFSGTGIDPVSGTFDPAIAGVGSHTILYTWIEPFGCEDFVDSVTFTIFENPEITAIADPIDCYEDSLTMLTINPVNGDGNYTITSDGDDIPLISEVMEGTYNIMVVDGNNCAAETSVNVTVPAEPMPTINGSTELIIGETSNYSIEQSLFTGLGIDSIVWTANGSVICNEVGCFSLSNEAPIVNTTYEVTVFYNNGCSVVRSIDVEVTEPDPIYTVDIPNIISPNNDGANDVWQIFTGDPEVIVSSVQIMDRWGNLIFEVSTPYSPITNPIIWDGKFGTADLQPGVFVYSVRYTQDGRERVRNGDITIIHTDR